MLYSTHQLLLLIVIFFSLFCSSFFILTFLHKQKRMGNPKLKKNYTVSIIIPAYNEERGIAETIQTALSMDYPKNLLEIIVVENNSTDKTFQIAKKFEKKNNVKVFHLDKAGKGNALNFALTKAKGEIVITMDADSYVRDKSLLKKILSHFSDKDIVSVAPAIRPTTPETYAQRIQYIEYVFGIFLRKIFSLLDSVYVTPGAFTAYRKSIFKKIGNFDQNTITEDFEMTLRIQTHHFRIANVIDAMVYTRSPRTFKALMAQRVRWFLGFIDCLIMHKKLFNKKYGYLGMFILPSAIISITLSLVLFLYTLAKAIISITNFLIAVSPAHLYNLLKFNLLNIKFDIFFYDIDPIAFVVFALLGLGVFIFFSARKYSKDDEKFSISFFVYLFAYVFVFASWWIKTILYKLVGKDVRFGGVVWNNSMLHMVRHKLRNI